MLDQDCGPHINILNNHSNFVISERYVPHVNVIHNRGTPDFATAMLGRMWNMALIHGFKDLNNPDADLVVTVQDDTVWNFDWLYHDKFKLSETDFIRIRCIAYCVAKEKKGLSLFHIA